MTLSYRLEGRAESERRQLPETAVEVQLGRSSDCWLELPNPSVSRHHAKLERRDGIWLVSDSGSRGGTFLDGARIGGKHPLASGSLLKIGPYEITVTDDDETPPPAAGHALTGKPAARDGSFVEEFKDVAALYTPEMMALTHVIHTDVLEKLNLSETALTEKNDIETLRNVERCLDQTLREHRHEIPSKTPMELFRQVLMDELTGFGPISPLIRSPRISEIMVNGPDIVFVESGGRLYDSGVKFASDRHLMSIIQRIVEPLGRHVDDASPMVDARLPDGSRVNAIIQPLSLRGAALTIRKFADKKLTTDDLVSFGSLTRDMAAFLETAVRARKNILVSGGTGSGKTTLLNVLSLFIPQEERVITVEDSAELKLSHRNIVTLEARPANVEGKGRVTIRDLVVNTLRMRPDRIIVGECRGAEALDMLQAMNTGHDGSLTTCHANSPRDALARLENMVMMAGMELPSAAIREQVASAIDLIVQQTRLIDGSRKIVKVSEVTGREGSQILMQDIFTFEQTGISKDGAVEGYHTATGNIPNFIDELRKSGRLGLDMSVFVPKV